MRFTRGRRFRAGQVGVFAGVRVVGAAVGEVLPDEKAHLVAQVVKVFGLVEAAAPDPQHRHAGVPRLRDALAQAGGGDECRERVVGNPVRAFGIDVRAVDAELEALAFAVGVRLADEFDGPQADLCLRLVRLAVLARKRQRQVIQRRLAVAIRLPAARGGDRDCPGHG